MEIDLRIFYLLAWKASKINFISCGEIIFRKGRSGQVGYNEGEEAGFDYDNLLEEEKNNR